MKKRRSAKSSPASEQAESPPKTTEANERTKRIHGGVSINLGGLGCLEELREICDRVEAEAEDGNTAAFRGLFLPVLDEAIDRIVEWIKSDENRKLKDVASGEFVERLMWLLPQADRLMQATECSQARRMEFGAGDRRKSRAPETKVTELALEYLREQVELRHRARIWGRYHRKGKQIRAEILDEDEKWLTEIELLPEFDGEGDNWEKWAEAVYSKMLKEQNFVRIKRALPSGKRFSQFKGAIFGAIKSNSRRPLGGKLGVTRLS